MNLDENHSHTWREIDSFQTVHLVYLANVKSFHIFNNSTLSSTSWEWSAVFIAWGLQVIPTQRRMTQISLVLHSALSMTSLRSLRSPGNGRWWLTFLCAWYWRNMWLVCCSHTSAPCVRGKWPFSNLMRPFGTAYWRSWTLASEVHHMKKRLADFVERSFSSSNDEMGFASVTAVYRNIAGAGWMETFD